MRILVVTRSYPSAGDLYQYPFVHRRVLAYRERGHEVAVFRPSPAAATHDYEGVTCTSGDAGALATLAAVFRPDVIAAHGFNEQMWPFLAPLEQSVPICAWLHGSEIPAFARVKAQLERDDAARAAALEAVQRRAEFWRRFLAGERNGFRLVFPSHSAVAMLAEDLGEAPAGAAVIANPIDTDLFSYRPRQTEHRLRVLMIRPFDSRSYGNDLAVAAISILSGRAGFERLSFTIVGDGPLFDETLAPIRALPNVRIERRFLTQAGISALHADHGQFLVPTRLDTQGVSRDEAMASGLVPVTNRLPVVEEFVDDSCAGLAAPDDAHGLADATAAIAEDPESFLSRSISAADRVRRDRSNAVIIPAELAFLTTVAGC